MFFVGVTAVVGSMLFGTTCQAASAADSVSLPTVTTAQTGAWMASFQAATNYAFSTGRPLVMLWSNDICDYCNAFKTSIRKSAFTSWQKDQPYVFCYVEGVRGSDPANNRGAKAFAANAGGYGEKNTGGYPMISLLWLDGGTAKAVATFTGRPGKMGVAAKSEMYMEFIEAIETTFAAYSESDLGSFPVGDLENDRFEAEPSTGVVRIPVDRDFAGAVATNVLTVTRGETTVLTTDVVWGADDTRTTVALDLEKIGSLSYDGSSTLNLTLTSPTDGSTTNGTLHLVADKPNAVKNPYFPGERDLDSLGWADWTLDWTLVTNKVAKANAAGTNSYLLAVFSGTLWCPYCLGIEQGLFDSPKFAAWLEENNIQLALFDQALAATDAYAGKAHLLSYDAGMDHYAGVANVMRSGAGYLTRHGLAEDDDVAQAVVARTQKLTVDWLAPGSTAARLSNPTLLLLDANGTVLGRFNAWRDRNRVFGSNVYYYDADENIARLNDLLKLAARGGEGNDYSQTTTLEHKVGDASSATLQVNSTTRWWNLSGAAAGTLTVGRTDDSSAAVTFTLLSGGKTIASGSGGFTAKLTKNMVDAGDLQLRVSTTAFSASVNPLVSQMAGGSEFEVAFVSSLEPAVVVDSATIPSGFAASIVLEELDVDDDEMVSVKKTAGTLPTGLKLKYDKATKSVILSGTPSKIVDTAFSYTVMLGTGRSRESLEPVEVSIEVFDPASVNPYLGKAQSATIPLVGEDGILVGTLTFSMTAKNRVTAKYAGASSTILSFSGAWGALGEEGTASLAAERSGVALDLSLDANGNVAATLSGITAAHSDFVSGGNAVFSGAAKLGADFAPFAGYYTVALPSEIEGVTGTGYLMLKFTSASALRSGKVSISGLLPNGQTISATSSLSIDPADSGYALLPVFKRTSANVFSALLRIQANGSALYADDETVRVVLAAESVKPYWSHVEAGFSYAGTVGVYGGWYPQGTTVPQWLEIFDEQSSPFTLELAIPAGGVESDEYGALVDAPSAEVLPDAKKGLLIGAKDGTVTISFNKSTGVFSGRGTIVFESGKSISGTYKGILSPGWLDCGCGDDRVILPFGSGTLFYSDRVGGRAVKKSITIELR